MDEPRPGSHVIGWLAFWAALALVFGGGEAWTRTARLAPFALAAAAAGGAACTGASGAAQWGVFAVVALVLALAGVWVRRRLRL